MKRQTLVVALLVFVAVTALWYMFGLRPINEKIGETDSQLQAAQDEAVLLQTRLARLQKIRDNELSYISAIGALEAQIPPTPSMPGLIEDLNTLADETGIDWLGATWGAPTEIEGAGYFEIPITLQVEGQFFELLGYLYGMSDLERLVRIDGVTISPTEQDGFIVLNVTINAKAFATSGIAVPEIPADEETTTTTTEPSTTTTTTEATTTTTTGGA